MNPDLPLLGVLTPFLLVNQSIPETTPVNHKEGVKYRKKCILELQPIRFYFFASNLGIFLFLAINLGIIIALNF